jgi:acyl-CoA thioester hydrolase
MLRAVHELQLRVRYAECDMQGHVFNSHYLTWFDMAHTEALRATVGSYQSLVERGIDFVVAEANVRYRSPARFDDELVVAVAFQPLGTTSLTSDFTVRRGDDLVAEGTLRHVCVDASTFVKTPWPEWVRSAIGG